MKKILNEELRIVNIGLESFSEALAEKNVGHVQVDWRPPFSVAESAQRALAAGLAARRKANARAVAKILAAQPVLLGLKPAAAAIPGMKKNMILHAGPPVLWKNMCGPMLGGVIGAILYEGWAKTPAAARKLAAAGEIEFSPCHGHQTVGPMAGIVSPSMPVFLVKNETAGNMAFCTMNEGLGKVLRYGAFDPEVIQRLRWLGKILAPSLDEALRLNGPLDLKMIIAQALHMGDELHNRNRAATSLLYRALAPAVIRSAATPETAAAILQFINGNDHFFLNLSMAASKASLDAARAIDNSSLVVAMARNGREFGIQLAGTGDEWFCGPAPVPDALFFPGFSKADANPDIGDSAITETNGLGGFAIAAAPAIVQFVGGSSADASRTTRKMYEITVAENNVYRIPYLDFRGTPTGIDVVKVIDSGILPFIDTGVAHKKAGLGQVGAGVLSAPAEPFLKAYAALAARCNPKEKKR
ncbi:MAG: DUF1116 domain-containing protein [Candidatus Aminicenantes bacterium]|nr:DUF1116 domain-containing protein [Candidatus Aminicenantes bacterium]